MSEKNQADEQATKPNGDETPATPPKKKRKPHPVTSIPREIRTQTPPALVMR